MQLESTLSVILAAQFCLVMEKLGLREIDLYLHRELTQQFENILDPQAPDIC